MGSITTAYFKMEITANNNYARLMADAAETSENLKELGIKYSSRSLYRIKKDQTKTFSINNNQILITKI